MSTAFIAALELLRKARQQLDEHSSDMEEKGPWWGTSAQFKCRDCNVFTPILNPTPCPRHGVQKAIKDLETCLLDRDRCRECGESIGVEGWCVFCLTCACGVPTDKEGNCRACDIEAAEALRD